MMRVSLTVMQLDAIKCDLRDQFQDDERGWLDLIEGETDAFELVRKLLDGIEVDEGDAAILAEQVEARKVRSERCKARVAARRQSIMAIMESASIDKLPLAEATLSLRKVSPKLVVTDADALPDDLCTFTRKPNLSAIKDADGPVPGTSLDNGGVSLTIRRK